MNEYIPFNQEERKNIIAFGEALRGIHYKLLAEGKIKFENGKTVWPEKILEELEEITKKRNAITGRIQNLPRRSC